MNYFSTHTGAGGACIAAKNLRMNLVGGIELDPYPVELYRANFGHSIRHESILATPINDLPDFDFFWTSPSCTKFSGSNREGGETELDIEIAAKIAELNTAQVKALDYRCLARLQGFPDWYKWGPTAGRNCKAIGNAVPIPLAEAVIRSLVG